jgi:large subunit ribosomal protein L18
MSKKLTNKSLNKANRYARRKHRVNTIVKKTSSEPRLLINRSNAHMQAQVIDQSWKVVAFASSLKISSGTKSEKAYAVWEDIAKTAVKNGVTKVVFDRNGHLYHGRVKQLAEWARAWWLDF